MNWSFSENVSEWVSDTKVTTREAIASKNNGWDFFYVETSTAAIMYAAPLNVILAVKPLKNIMSENLQPVFLRLLLSFYDGEYVIAPDKV